MIIKARFASTCSACNGPIRQGENVEWSPRQRGAKHPTVAICEAAKLTEAAPAVRTPIVIGGIVTFLQAAADRGMKFPKVRFLSPDKTEMRLSLAGARARYPGSVQIQIAGNWIGGVMPDGIPSGAVAKMRDVLDLLVEIADDPVNAAQHG